MAKIKTECSCGQQHDLDKDSLEKMQLTVAPEFIDCSECPVCSPEFFDTPEAHEDEAYKEEVDVAELEKALEDDDLADIDEMDDDFEEEV